jgi:hypothetical protein
MYRATAAYGHFGRQPAQMTTSEGIIGGKNEKRELHGVTWGRPIAPRHRTGAEL